MACKSPIPIVGIYTAPEYASGQQNFTADTVFVPKASVPGSEAYENENVNFCNALILKNGTQEAFEAYMKEQGADGYFTYCDQGYTQMHAAYQAQAQGARRLLLLGAAVLCLTAAVCWQIQAHRSAAAIHTMRLLGVSAGVVVGEQLRATLPVIALSSLFGGQRPVWRIETC